MMCNISFLYMPIYMDHMDVGVVIVVQDLHDDHTILPLILVETYISTSYCRAFGDSEFWGSSVLLYIWFITHLWSIDNFRYHGFCFGHNIAIMYSFRPSSCVDAAYG